MCIRDRLDGLWRFRASPESASETDTSTLQRVLHPYRCTNVADPTPRRLRTWARHGPSTEPTSR
eukprot:1952792-Alexandrium_andersonii.AAC.1